MVSLVFTYNTHIIHTTEYFWFQICKIHMKKSNFIKAKQIKEKTWPSLDLFLCSKDNDAVH